MPTVYLPMEHSEAELALAGRVAEALECSALYVTWSPRGYEECDREGVLVAAPAVSRTVTPAGLSTSARGDSRLARALSHLATFIAAVFTAPHDVERERPLGAP